MSEDTKCPECHNDLEEYIETVRNIRSQLKHITNRSMDLVRCPRCGLEMRLINDPEKGYRVYAPGMGRGMRGMRGTGGPGVGDTAGTGGMGGPGMGRMGGVPPEGGLLEEEGDFGEGPGDLGAEEGPYEEGAEEGPLEER